MSIQARRVSEANDSLSRGSLKLDEIENCKILSVPVQLLHRDGGNRIGLPDLGRPLQNANFPSPKQS